jgi:hypothetical protein
MDNIGDNIALADKEIVGNSPLPLGPVERYLQM